MNKFELVLPWWLENGEETAMVIIVTMHEPVDSDLTVSVEAVTTQMGSQGFWARWSRDVPSCSGLSCEHLRLQPASGFDAVCTCGLAGAEPEASSERLRQEPLDAETQWQFLLNWGPFVGVPVIWDHPFMEPPYEPL